MDIWGILEIDKTRNENDIKMAYRKKLRYVNPEDDSEGFMKLRDAYEKALQYINEPEILTEGINSNTIHEEALAEFEGDDDTKVWIKQIDQIYIDLKKRFDIAAWREVFKEDICIGIDSSLEIREKLLVYLMDHFRLPHEIWRLIDDTFHVISDREDLEEQFPMEFLDYICNQIGNGSYLDFNLFQIRDIKDETLIFDINKLSSSHASEEMNTLEPKLNIDQYITTYFELKRDLDEDNIENCEKYIHDIEEYHIYHPYQDIEKIRFLIEKNNLIEAAELSGKLFNDYPKQIEIRLIHGKVNFLQEKYEEAYKIYRELTSDNPTHYEANKGKIECLIKKKEYVEAKEIVLDLWDEYPQDEVFIELLDHCNEELVQQYEIKDKEYGLDDESKLECAWCFYQLQRFDKAKDILDHLPLQLHEKYDYINLIGRVLLALEQYKEALVKLKLWLDEMLRLKQETREVNYEKRCRNIGYAYYSIGLCYLELSNYDEAILYFQKSIEEEKNSYQKIIAMDRLNYTYLQHERYEECIEGCDQLLAIVQSYYPAYLYSIEANFNLEKDQEVIDQSYKAIEIFPNDVIPYRYALKVYLRHDQLENAKEIVEIIEKQGLEDDEVELLRIQLARRMSEYNNQFQKVLSDCLRLKHKLQNQRNNIQENSAVDLELALLYINLKKYKDAIVAIDSAIIQKPENEYYHFTKGRILKESRDYVKAIDVFHRLSEDYDENVLVLYELAECYIKILEVDIALEYYLKVYEIYPEYQDVMEKIMDIYLDKYTTLRDINYFKSAKIYADKMVEAEGNSYNLISRGILYMRAYEFELALADYYKAMEYEPESWAPYNNVGYVYEIMRDMDQAVENLINATELIPLKKNSLPYGNLAACYHILGNYEKAILIYEELHKAYPKETDYIKCLSEIYKSQGKYKKCIEYQELLLELTDDKEMVYQELGYLYFKLKRYYKVKSCYKRATEYYKKNIDNYYFYAKFLLETNKNIKSINTILKIAHFAKHDEIINIDICDKIAAIYWRNYQKCKKIKSKKKLGDKFKQEARDWAMKALQHIERFYESEDKFYSYKATSKNNLITLSMLYLYLGNTEKASLLLEQASQLYACSNCYHRNCNCAEKVACRILEAKG